MATRPFFFTTCPSTLIAIEAYGGSHHWARLINRCKSGKQFGLALQLHLCALPESIETALELWASSLRDVKARMRPLFTQERVANSASQFLDGLLGEERRKTGWMRAEAAGDPGPWRQQAILGRGHWDADALRDIVRDYALETLADAHMVALATGTPSRSKASAPQIKNATVMPIRLLREAQIELVLQRLRSDTNSLNLLIRKRKCFQEMKLEQRLHLLAKQKRRAVSGVRREPVPSSAA
ncbi:hypothetical protein GFPCMMHI_06352 [Ensifer adhaerens]|nr:hypothetical protein [Ensifer adhaerens]